MAPRSPFTTPTGAPASIGRQGPGQPFEPEKSQGTSPSCPCPGGRASTVPGQYQLFPALDPATEAALRASIRRFGVLVPVVKDQHGNLLDGHHRERIAEELGVKYRVDIITVADDEERQAIIASLNCDRGHRLRSDMRREIVADLRKAGHSLRAIAGAAGVSEGQVRKDIAAEELRTGTQLAPERVNKQGGGSYPARRPTVAAKNEKEAARALAALSLVDTLPNTPVIDVKRAERLAREAETRRLRTVSVEPAAGGDLAHLRAGDFRDVLADLEPGSIDAIITDPPYPIEYVPLFADLGRLAARVLKPGGTLAALVGQSHLAEYIALLGEWLDYRWVGALIVQGPRARIWCAQVGVGWKPVLMYVPKGTLCECRFLLDDVFASGGKDKEHHLWGQSESGFAALIERLTEPGDLVVDPFLGGGTTAVVCRDLGRRFIGCDIDEAAIATARERLA